VHYWHVRGRTSLTSNWGSWSLPRSVTTPAPGPGKYDDADLAWTYAGAWSTPAVGPAYHGTLHVGTGGASTAFTFNGASRFTLTYVTNTGWGTIGVYLDGSPTPIATINSNGSPMLTLYTSPILSTGVHTVSLVQAGAPIAIDALQLDTTTYQPAGVYDDSDAAWGDSGFWFPIPIAPAYGGNLNVAVMLGSSKAFPFTGRGYTLRYVTNTGLGKIAVYVDGAASPVVTLNANAAPAFATYTGPALALGNHTVTFKSAGSAGTLIMLDSITVSP
jgi:hypothetical protein